jgi:hypothetical protein
MPIKTKLNKDFSFKTNIAKYHFNNLVFAVLGVGGGIFHDLNILCHTYKIPTLKKCGMSNNHPNAIKILSISFILGGFSFFSHESSSS